MELLTNTHQETEKDDTSEKPTPSAAASACSFVSHKRNRCDFIIQLAAKEIQPGFDFSRRTQDAAFDPASGTKWGKVAANTASNIAMPTENPAFFCRNGAKWGKSETFAGEIILVAVAMGGATAYSLISEEGM